MKIPSLTINVTDVFDSLTLEQNELVSSIFKNAEKFVKDGGKIILQREYTNDSPDVLATFSTVEEVRNWKQKVNELQKVLGRKPVE